MTKLARTPDQMRSLGQKLACVAQAGDVILLVGALGAGKTTFVQGLGLGLGVEGKITSPTYIVARVHFSVCGGPNLVHVDAYRIEDALDFETVDLDADMEESVTVVEWGRGRAENLSDDRLEVEITFADTPLDATEDQFVAGLHPRIVRFVPTSERWVSKLQKVGLL